MKKILLAAIALSGSLNTFAAPVFGVDYDVLLSPSPNDSKKVLVQEFFSYNCLPCLIQSNLINPSLNRWAGKIQHERIALKGRINAGYSAKIYYSLDEIDPKGKAHFALLNASAQTPDIPLTTKETNTILQKHQIPLNRFSGIFSSVQIAKKEADGYKLAAKYQIAGDSAVIVNGRYTINKDTKNFPVVLNYLIDKEYQRINSK